MTLDSAKALDCALKDLDLDPEISDPDLGHELAQTLVGLVDAGEDASTRPGPVRHQYGGASYRGVGRKAGLLVIAEQIKAGMQLAFCKRSAEAAKHDLLRIVADVRAQSEAAGGRAGARCTSVAPGAADPISGSATRSSRWSVRLWATCR